MNANPIRFSVQRVRYDPEEGRRREQWLRDEEARFARQAKAARESARDPDAQARRLAEFEALEADQRRQAARSGIDLRRVAAADCPPRLGVTSALVVFFLDRASGRPLIVYEPATGQVALPGVPLPAGERLFTITPPHLALGLAFAALTPEEDVDDWEREQRAIERRVQQRLDALDRPGPRKRGKKR
jgi:hypothetical protein